MQSTVKIFRHLYERLPPLFPQDVALRMKAALDNVEGRNDIPVEKIEDIMVQFGYELWPWNQAYKEFFLAAEGKLGEHFLVPLLSPSLGHKYEEFKAFGGAFHNLRNGRPAEFFTPEERIELCHALVEMQVKLREYVAREVAGMAQKAYLARVQEFKKVFEEIKQHLEALRALAEAESDHPNLAEEIQSKVRHFEHSLCWLAPELRYEAVCKSHEFFCGRKTELSRLRGIHVPMRVDFYNN